MVNPVQIPEGVERFGDDLYGSMTPRARKVRDLLDLLYPPVREDIGPSMVPVRPPDPAAGRARWQVGVACFHQGAYVEVDAEGDTFEEAEKALLHEVCERLRDRAVALRTAAEEAEALL